VSVPQRAEQLSCRQLTDVVADQSDEQKTISTQIVDDEPSDALFPIDVIVGVFDVRVVGSIHVDGVSAQLTSDVRQLHMQRVATHTIEFRG